jgi:hypothetical protein
MTKTLLLLTLFLIPACATIPEAFDGSVASDVDLPDVVTVLGDGAVVHVDGGVMPDASTVDDAWAPDTGVVVVDAGSDSGSLAADVDAGHDAATFSGDAWMGVCGDGIIDPPETCDPGSAHSHSSFVCHVGGPECQWCTYGLTDAGCVYGDYLYVISPPTTWATSCRPSPGLSWVVWHTAAERDAIIAAYRSIHAGGGTTNVSGWIGLHAASDTAPFLWEDDGSVLTAATLLPIHNGRGAGAQCMTLTVTDTDAYLMYEPCSGIGRSALCFTQPWGTTR